MDLPSWSGNSCSNTQQGALGESSTAENDSTVPFQILSRKVRGSNERGDFIHAMSEDREISLADLPEPENVSKWPNMSIIYMGCR